MKITRILPKSLATSYQRHDINRLEGSLAYHKAMVRLYEELLEDAVSELKRLNRESK